MAAPVSIDVADAFDGADLLRALDRHGLIARLVAAGDRYRVEVTSPRGDQRIFLAELGVALVRWSGGDKRIPGATGELAWPPDGDTTAYAAALRAGDRAGEAVRLRLRTLLLGAVWFELDRRREQLRIDGASADAVGRQLAGAAFDAVLARLGDYHGQSRFTTWAAKFAIHEAAVAARGTGAKEAPPGEEAVSVPDHASPVHLEPQDASRPQPSLRSSDRLPSAVAHGSLEDGLTVCLGLLAREPDRFERAAVAWYARWCESLDGLPFTESRTALSALEAMMGPEPAAGARALSRVCRRHGLDELAAVLDEWLKRRGGGVAALHPSHVRGGPPAP